MVKAPCDIKVLTDNLFLQTYEFEPDQIARMLSPKHIRNKPLSLDVQVALGDYECLIDAPLVEKALECLPRLDPLKEHAGWEVNVDRPNLPPLIAFLNQCVEHCDQAYRQVYRQMDSGSPFKVVPKEDSWIPHMQFYPNRGATDDNFDNLPNDILPAKPGIVGISNRRNYDPTTLSFHWICDGRTVSKGPSLPIILGGEVGSSWQSTVLLCGRHAQMHFIQSPLRPFSVSFAYHYLEQSMRFYVFHRGGVSSTTPLHLGNLLHVRVVEKLIFSLMLHSSSAGVTHPDFQFGKVFDIPSLGRFQQDGSPISTWHQEIVGRGTWVIKASPARDGTDGKQSCDTETEASAIHHDTKSRNSSQESKKIELRERQLSTEAKRIHHSAQSVPSTDSQPYSSDLIALKFTWCSPSAREKENEYYNVCDGVLGTARPLGLIQLCSPDGIPITNSVYLPPLNPGDDLSKYYWSIFPNTKKELPLVFVRSFWVTAMADVGTHITQCTNTVDLAECLLHALLGWLSLFQRGYFFRGFEVCNILKLRQPSTSHKPLNLWEVSAASISDHPLANGRGTKAMVDLRLLPSGLVDSEDHQKLLEIVEELEATLKCAGVKDECKAILIDGTRIQHIDRNHEVPAQKVKHLPKDWYISPKHVTALQGCRRRSYFHSPTDEIWSFIFVILWAGLYNVHHPSESKDESRWKEYLRTYRVDRTFLIFQYYDRELPASGNKKRFQEKPPRCIEQNFSPICTELYTMIAPWFNYMHKTSRVNNQEGNSVASENTDDYKTKFLLQAYMGVLGFARTVVDLKQNVKDLNTCSDSS